MPVAQIVRVRGFIPSKHGNFKRHHIGVNGVSIARLEARALLRAEGFRPVQRVSPISKAEARELAERCVGPAVKLSDGPRR